MDSQLLGNSKRRGVGVGAFCLVDNLLRKVRFPILQHRNNDLSLVIGVGSDFKGTSVCVLAQEECTSTPREFFLDWQRLFFNEALIFVNDFVNNGLRSIGASQAGILGILFNQGTLLRTNEALQHMDIYQTLNLSDGDC